MPACLPVCVCVCVCTCSCTLVVCVMYFGLVPDRQNDMQKFAREKKGKIENRCNAVGATVLPREKQALHECCVGMHEKAAQQKKCGTTRNITYRHTHGLVYDAIKCRHHS